MFRGRAARTHSPLPSQPAGGATINPETDPGGGARRRGPRKQETVVLVCETPVGFERRCIIVEYCHLPNCCKRASSPPPIVIIAEACLLPSYQAWELMNEPPRRGKSWELSSVVLPKGAGYKSSFILTTFTLIILGARDAALRLH